MGSDVDDVDGEQSPLFVSLSLLAQVSKFLGTAHAWEGSSMVYLAF